MPSLLSLPAEITQDICFRLVGRGKDGGLNLWDPKSLSHFCQTSKTIHHIGTPILYAGFKGETGLKRSADFLRTISLRPELGKLVQELYILVYRSHALDQSQKDAFRKAAARLGVGIPGWIDHRPFEAVACLLIAQAPNLKTLNVYLFNDIYVDADLSPFNIFEDASAPVSWRASLSHLRQLCLGHGSQEISLDYFGGILKFATGLTDLSLRSSFDILPDLSLWSSFDMPPTRAPCHDLMHLGNVTRLAVKGSHWTQSELELIVSRCPALDGFRYQSLEVKDNRVSCTVNPRELIETLRKYGHNNTLRSLAIDMEDRDRSPEDDIFPIICSDGEQISSLKDFSQLETFCVDGTSILFPAAGSPDYRADVLTAMLPSCIRRFRLFDAPEESVANMSSLAESIADFPFLREVTLGVDDRYGDWEICDGPEMTSLMDLLTAGGVRFEKGYGRWGWSLE
ncbi:hypothetical protein J3F83DRAFT_67437 [Trichoderma novae-zelandiae]